MAVHVWKDASWLENLQIFYCRGWYSCMVLVHESVYVYMCDVLCAFERNCDLILLADVLRHVRYVRDAGTRVHYGGTAQMRFYGGTWVSHAPQIFAWPPFAPPVLFLISRLSSFGWHIQGCQMPFVKIPAILSTAPDLSCVVIRKQHREIRDNQFC